ncbi:angiopoietin-2-like [Anopheles funestus]|uniref:angiopoietin-2-like n=1 Tax=Anopheles funestus TaxID=62324 RepID=UPI0020C630FC|nr:angiopoietin-2-like [Anopheles funestus]XP_049285770.1 angiopoietin-2-like [Anopheles funestus]XP_049285771.1 angiopoietin-2-like [Anopheles funestus]XP_049285772.1 angiopoietin-2-like [Anopheles funestus]XP_049285773.1 angiopoietin-2-like [Anopheles funestus]XP_049285774.1 angiopoietin-2-like [Anopheles funestus]
MKLTIMQRAPLMLMAMLMLTVIARSDPVPGEVTPVQDIRVLLEDVKSHLNRFNSHYLINLEQRIVSLLTTMTSLDANVKTLQEKSQIWDVFQHHIGAWSEHIKSVDNKLDILRKAHDTPSPTLETRLSSLDFKVQHIFEKVDVINEKLHDITKTVYALSSSSANNRGRRNDRLETAAEQAAILTKIGHLQKQINRIESNGNSCQNKNNGQGNRVGASTKLRKDVSDSDEEMDEFLDKLTAKKLREMVSNRKQCRSLDALTGMVRSIEDRTIRIYDLEANQFEQILSCCQRTNHEVATFTNSADILLKRIEHLVLDVDRKVEKRNNSPCTQNVTDVDRTVHHPIISSTEAKEDESLDASAHVDIGSGSEGTSTNADDTIVSSGTIEQQDEISFHHPDKDGCHQLLKRISGVYTFAEVELNEARRDYNRRYCEFSTDGTAWTVIQRRNLYDLQENFNRSWNEYKFGFGDLGYEFWLGNDFIHRLSYDDNVELRVELEDFEGNKAYAEYGAFRIESEKFNYNIMISDYHGNASDGLAYHNDQDFSTYDRANDRSVDSYPCALTFGSGWWFNRCAASNLNGKYYLENPRNHKSTGILWESWLGDYSLKAAKMLIRPKDTWNKDEDMADNDAPVDP